MSWQEDFKSEFGIHFKDSSGELDFAIVFIEEVLDKQKQELITIIKSMKCDERKMSVFGKGMDSWEAQTYDDKQLVNAVLKTIISKIK